MTMRIGLISDTHGLLRPQALQALEGVTHIIHAGDIGNSEVLGRLAEIAPVTAIRGNNDTEPWAALIPETTTLEIAQMRIYMLHDVKQLDIDLAATQIGIVVAGHSHRPLIERRDSILFINPGSAGPRRFKLPISVGFLDIADRHAEARIHLLD
jgi:putative phosphoesterase